MAEFITRKFTDKTDGTPRTGLNVRLKSVTDPALDPIILQEIVTTVEADQGQYYAAATPGGSPTLVPHGVYTIERDEGSGYAPFEGEISVNPLRSTGNKTGVFPLLDRVVADVVRVSSFLADNEVGTMAHIQEAVNYAATRGGHVVVGAYGAGVNGTIWTGSPISVPDGITLDLAGATLYANSATDVSVLNFAGAATIKNGTLKTEYVSGSRVCTQADAGSNVNFVNVSFVRAGTAYPTCADSSNDETPTSYYGCQPVTLAPAFGDGGLTRLQRAYGCIPVYEVNGAIPNTQIERANVSGGEVAEIIRNIPTALGTAPSLTPPFYNGERFVEAVKQLWFVDKPVTDAALAISARERFKWNGLTTSPGDVLNISDLVVYGTVPSSVVTASRLERKAIARGEGIHEEVEISFAASINFAHGAVNAGNTAQIHFEMDMSDLEAVYDAAAPGALPLISSLMTPGGVYNLYHDDALKVGDYSPFKEQYAITISPSLTAGSIHVQISMDYYNIVGYSGSPTSRYIKLATKLRIPVMLSTNHYVAGNAAYATLYSLAD